MAFKTKALHEMFGSDASAYGDAPKWGASMRPPTAEEAMEGFDPHHSRKSGAPTVWDDPEFTAARYMNYRRDLLPVEKAVGLTGACTFKEAWAAVHEKRVTVDGSLACLGDMVAAQATVALDGVVLPQREPIVCYLLNKPRQVMCTCSVGETATKGELDKARY